MKHVSSVPGPVALPFRDVVVLVPGFLGLGRIGRFYYYSERIAAALRAGLEARSGRPILIVPCCSRPIGSLKCRQAFLLEQLQTIRQEVPTVERIHLVGHSTGGVDAQFLACEQPLGGGRWDRASARSLLASVVGISVPYHGTFLVQAPEVRVLAGELSASGVGGFVGLLGRLALLLADQPATGDVLAGALQQTPDAAAFLYQILRHRELIHDLDPVNLARMRAGTRPDRSIPLTSFVTVAGLAECPNLATDAFFRKLYGLTARSAVPSATSTAALQRLRALSPLVRDEKTSDGVVNTAHQLLDPGDPDELGAVVVADHADVLGHYDRGKRPLEEKRLKLGLFHSGSGFDDDNFFQLFDQVASAIWRTMPEASRQPVVPAPVATRLIVSSAVTVPGAARPVA